jgi:transcriptional regulator with XRE-family HTH domain
MVFAMTLGEKIHQLRTNNGWSQEQLAMRITVSRQAISKWELGESVPDVDNIVQLSKIFGVTTDYLLTDDDDIVPDDSSGADSANADSEIILEVMKSRHHRVAIIFGGIFTLLGLCGVLVIWILSVINPVVYEVSYPVLVGTEPPPAIIYTGLRAFLMSHNATGLFIFLSVIGAVGLITGVVGLVVSIYPFLESFFKGKRA